MTEPSGPGFRSLGGLEEAGRRATAPGEWAYVQGGAEAEVASRANRRAFERRTLIPRILTDVSRVDPSAVLLGTGVRLPYWIAPMARHGYLHPDGEVATARAAGGAGVIAGFSTLSSRSLEEIATASPTSPKWFQLYLQATFSESRALVERAERAGYRAILLTTDVPVLGPRDGLLESGFDIGIPGSLGNGPRIAFPAQTPTRTAAGFTLGAGADATWSVIDDLLSVTRLPVIVKGILSIEDAERAIGRGARALVVSNHGGRQLDAAPAPLDVLEPIARAVGARAEVYVDGGIRRGSDIVTALALGARSVGLGRPVLWALAAGGEAGVAHYLSLLESEFVRALAMCGCRRLTEVDSALLGPLRTG